MLSFTPELIWVDMQMSGLDPITNRILQFACILSDGKLTNFQEGPHIIMHCDEQHLTKMDQWNTTHHKKSGLYEQCLNSKITIKEAQQQIITYLTEKGIMKGQLIIAGNSVHQDKLFLFHQMKQLDQFLHYRILDVSSFKFMMNKIKPNLFYRKKNSHRAVDDIIQSIQELKYYMKNGFCK